MPLDTKHHDLQSLRIDRSAKSGEGEPAPWAKRYIIIGISIVVLLSLSALMYRLLAADAPRSEEHTSELQSHSDLVCRLLLEKKKKKKNQYNKSIKSYHSSNI